VYLRLQIKNNIYLYSC